MTEGPSLSPGSQSVRDVEKVAEGLVLSLCACELIGKRVRHVSVRQDNGRAVVYRTRMLHSVECPLNGKAEAHAKKLVIPLAERIVRLQDRVKLLEAQLAGADSPSPTQVPFEEHFTWPTEMHGYFETEGLRAEMKKLLQDVAEALGGKVDRYSWSSIPDIPFLIESVTARKVRDIYTGKKKLETIENAANLSIRQDGMPYYRAVFPTRARAQAFVGLGRKLKGILDGVHKAGKLYGSDLLHRLARQDITPDAFLEKVEGKEKA